MLHSLHRQIFQTLTFSAAEYQPKILKAELQPEKNWLAKPQSKNLLAGVLWQKIGSGVYPHQYTGELSSYSGEFIR